MQRNEDLSVYRLEKSRESLACAKSSYAAGFFADAASNSYFTVFHAMRSVLALESVDFKKHTAVISYFRESYVKTGKLEKKLSDIIGELFRIRSKSDYEDFYVVSKEEVKKQIENAEYFVTEVGRFLEKL